MGKYNRFRGSLGQNAGADGQNGAQVSDTSPYRDALEAVAYAKDVVKAACDYRAKQGLSNTRMVNVRKELHEIGKVLALYVQD